MSEETMTIGGEIAALRAQLATSEDAHAQVEDRRVRYQTELGQIKQFLLGVTPEQGDPISVSAAQAREHILEQGLQKLQDEIKPLEQRVMRDRHAVQEADRQLRAAQQLMVALQSVDSPHVQGMSVGDLRLRVSRTRALIARLSGTMPGSISMTFE